MLIVWCILTSVVKKTAATDMRFVRVQILPEKHEQNVRSSCSPE